VKSLSDKARNGLSARQAKSSRRPVKVKEGCRSGKV
jgi:hypothetical protein